MYRRYQQKTRVYGRNFRNRSARKPRQQSRYSRERFNMNRTILDDTGRQDNLVIMNDPGRFVPDRIFTKLKFMDAQRTRGNAAAQVTNWYYQSSVRTVDQTNSVNGFADLNDIYSRFRVHSMTVKIEVTNPLTTPIVTVLWGGTGVVTLPNNTATLAQIQNAMCLPEATSCLSGTTNATALVKCKQFVPARKVYGPDYFRNPTSVGDITTDPTTMFFVNVGIYNTAAANFGALIPVLVTVELDVECFARYISI